MEPITREEYYLAKIAGTYKGKTPEPVTIEEYYLATMAGDYSGNTPQPVTRLQYYMAKVAGVWDGSIPAPVTRLEYYWAAIANGEGEVFPPVTREEHFLTLVADAYSVVLTVVTGNPALLEGVKGSRFTSLTLYGKSTQRSTTGANILKDNYLSLCKGNIDLFSANGLFTANANCEKPCEFNLYFSAESIFTDGIKDEATYYFVFRPIGFTPKYSYQLSLKNEKSESLSTSSNGNVTSVSGADLKKNVRIQLYFFNVSVSEPVVSGSKFQMIFSQKPDCNYEPYTGGNPSPSPSYPQEIESAGQGGEIGIEVGNNGYIQKGTYFLDVRQFPLKKGYTYYIKGEKIIGNDINCFVLNEYNKNFKNSAELFNYGYTTKKLTIPNSTGIVDEECRMPMKYDKDGYTFTVKAEGLYLYQAVNEPAKNTDEFYVGYTPNIVDEEYKKQTLIIPTPNGLPGIRVSSGGNYTDEKGQQWVCDTIEFRNGVAERVQRISKTIIDGDNVKFSESSSHSEFVNLTWYSAPGVASVRNTYMNAYFPSDFFSSNTNYDFIFTTSTRIMQYFETIKELNAFFAEKYVEGNPLTIFYTLRSPTRIPLTAEELAKLKALRTYSPTTTVINDACAGMSVGYAKMK
jgi:hypothetical protein